MGSESMKLNGYEIEKTADVPHRQGNKPNLQIIFGERETERGKEYVTALHCVGEREWCWGHYFTDAFDALGDFIERTARGY
jgi:hypothetical protein